MRNAYKTEGKRQLGRPRRKRDVKLDLGEIGWEGVEWIHLAQDRDQWRGLLNTIMNFRVP
jgi:hypothetical protein